MGDWIDDIRRLGELRNEGFLTDDEYIKEKNLILAESQNSPQPVKTGPQSISEPSEVPIEKKRFKWTRGNEVFLILFTLVYAMIGPFLEWYYQTYPSERETRISASDVFEVPYPEDSILGLAMWLDLLFGGLFGFLFGVILVGIWNRVKNIIIKNASR